MLVAAGTDITFTASVTAELYEPTSGTWTETGDLNTARNLHTANLLPNGMVLVAGGADTSQSEILENNKYNYGYNTQTHTYGDLSQPRA